MLPTSEKIRVFLVVLVCFLFYDALGMVLEAFTAISMPETRQLGYTLAELAKLGLVITSPPMLWLYLKSRH